MMLFEGTFDGEELSTTNCMPDDRAFRLIECSSVLVRKLINATTPDDVITIAVSSLVLIYQYCYSYATMVCYNGKHYTITYLIT